MVKWFIFLIVIACGVLSNLYSQILPKNMTLEEQVLMKEYIQNTHQRTVNCNTQSPGESIRTMAEWEELDAIAITWQGFSSILTQIVKEVVKQCRVIIICKNEESVKNYLMNAGVTIDENIVFIEGSLNSIWIRDYGPNTVYLNDVNSRAFVDLIYNRPRPSDDVIPELISESQEIPIYCTVSAPNDLVHTGGNFMADGISTAFSSELVLEENDDTNQWGSSNHSEEDIDQIMTEYMGIDTYVKMDVLPYDGIHHIDMHMKLINESTLLVGQYPEGIADGPQIEANIQYLLDSFETPSGKKYKIIRMPMPPENGLYPDNFGDYRTYTNAVFVNKTILVPFYEEKYDTIAQRIWEEAMPGYNVVGIDCNSIIPLSGAIHCITKEIGVDEPLLIRHEPYDDVQDFVHDYKIEATIKHKSGISNALLYYTTSLTEEYTAIDMYKDVDDVRTADIPNQNGNATVYYYIDALANDGKQQVRPLTAPVGYFSFDATVSVPVADVQKEQNSIVLQDVYPNPASSITCIPVKVNTPVYAQLKLKDILGRSVIDIHNGIVQDRNTNYFFDASKLIPGVYFIELTYSNFKTVKKIIVN